MNARKKLILTAVFLTTANYFIYTEVSPVQSDPTAAVKYRQNLSLTYEDVEWRIDSMSFPDILQYFAWNNASSCKIFHDFGGNLIVNGTVAGYNGQRALCLDRKVMPDPRKCLVLSFGMSQYWSFDKDMLQFGCEVYSFDPKDVRENYTSSSYHHYYQMGLDSRNYEAFKVPMRSLKTIYESPLISSNFTGAVIDYLKVDVEYAEREVLPDIIASGMMDRVRQLAVKVNLLIGDDLNAARERAKVLQSVEKYGMVRFNSKPNLFSIVSFRHGSGTHPAPDSYDIAFYNSKLVRESDL